MKSYKQNPMTQTKLIINKTKEGETIEQKIDRIVNNGEPIKDGAPIIHTPRAEGVAPQYDIRTDRHEIAVELAGTIKKSYATKREERLKKAEGKTDETKTTEQNDPLEGTK